MNYPQSLGYLNAFLNWEKIAWSLRNRLWNLDRMALLLEWFDHPERAFFPVLIAGTKGKGSTGFFLESILRAAGYPVGFYTSPHLEEPRERIRVNGAMISKADWLWGLESIRRGLAKRPWPASLGDCTYFEVMTLLAMLVFARKKLRIGIFEVGMGGRLDATNCMDVSLSILTSIHFDHEAVLGHTLTQITREKAAIIRSRSEVVVCPQHPEAMRVIQSTLRKKKARGWKIKAPSGMKLGLPGDFQRINAGAACRAAERLGSRYGFPVSGAQIREGLRRSVWPGRLERIQGTPAYLLDVAHNPSSSQALTAYLKRTYPKKDRLLLFGTSQDKNASAMFRYLSGYFSEVVLTEAANPRAKSLPALLKEAQPYFKAVYPQSDIGEALAMIRNRVRAETLVVVTGSFYIVGEVRKQLKAGALSPKRVK